ncbi:MAG: diguanylate cyclase [Clostridiales bacterium]|jgi:diguanylate cyclase (GGDEF)-like protein|nr:diguanylate cyclase [Clostridiales bacterium]
MSENQTIDMNQMLNALSGGLLRIALDDELTIMYATDTFYKLIEMDQAKQAKPPKSIFKTVYSADIILYTQQIAAQKRRSDKQFLLFYRILQKNGGLKWIMISGSKTDEEFQKQNKTFPIYFCMALDISEHMTAFRKMEQELDYHRTILELSKELFFEYDIAADTLNFKELFREVFGKESEIENFSKRLEKTKLIYPDDLPSVLKIYKSMMGGKKQARIELRMITKDGDIAWYVCYASIIFDDNKNPFKVVGKMSLINTKQEAKKAPKILLDSLTNVYTKDCAENLILDIIQNQDQEDISAIFLCEVRNYKALNEVVRIVDGENVLTSIAGILKKQFRRTDIIGRMGLGDFLVYMKSIRSERNAYEKAENICKEVNKLYSFDYSKNGVILSIGVSLFKGQADFQAEMANAKAALVMAKKDNTSSFEIFYPSLSK